MTIVWEWLYPQLGSFVVTLTVFIFGITARGEWVVITVHLIKQFGGFENTNASGNFSELSWQDISLKSLHLEGLPTVWIYCNALGYTIYFLVGGFLHWYFYIKRRDNAVDWKCQPTKWLPPELEREEIIFGCTSLIAVNTVTSMIACYIANGGWSMVYYKFDQYPWWWYFLQWPVIFVYQVEYIGMKKIRTNLLSQDYSTYLLHRLYHTPWLYKRFHKAHHRYTQPTAFSVTAIHPLEIVHIQLTMCVPLVIIPTHWTSFTAIGLYTYYNGIIDHSGIDIKAPWWQPWRPDTIFHDNHHQYFHVNFGFNCYWWDILHGTYRRKDRIYKEDIFYGIGKPLSKATKEELEDDIKQRLSENNKAHRYGNIFLDSSTMKLTH